MNGRRVCDGACISPVRRAVAACLLGLASGLAAGQRPWPAKPIRIIVPFPAGGQTDVAARLVGQALGEALKIPVVIENRAGAHGLIGGAEAARAPADGYTLLVASTGAVVINPLLYEKMPYDPLLDFAPVSQLINVPIVVMTSTQALPAKTLKELVAHARANPGKLDFSSAGNGGSSHLVAEYFKYRTGTSMTHVPFKGEAPATEAVVAGHVHLMFNTLVSTLPQMKSGRVRVLATTTRERLPELPDVPTVAETLGLKDFEASSWTALYAPAGTAQEIVQRISAQVDEALKRPALAGRLKELGAVAVGGTPEQLAQLQRTELEKWRQVVKAGRIKAD
ncbi:tripartite tricarboxylate transporter substrate binding protein [Variovorax paradoxus]|uniref:Bug family tripartite tricarboxylate transporter substrate binding protein n=1 Tax=Variovorax paradoxus TaxID=34073 RepID=UPI0021AD4B12|nr:tripartite tricarboxylate transporter substrate binding protein [Variovorax paradoxus]UVH60571.1 tripartite tricarboxylate transporter substrate binding protein [Variovorax paradoxus]